MNIRLEYHDQKSAKFWEIQVDGACHVVTYGKIGTNGQSKTKDFESAEAALKEAEKLIASKKKKGYVKTTNADSSQASPNTGYDQLINAKKQVEALCRHFSYLTDSPGFSTILKEIMKKVEKVEVAADNLVLHFPENERLIATPPGKTSDYKKWPKSFISCISKHESLSFPEENYGILLGNHQNYDIENLGEDFLGKAATKDVLSPLFDYADPWLFHPEEKNSTGEPALYLYDHEWGEVLDASAYNVGAQYLLLLAKTLDIDIAPEEPKLTDKTLKEKAETANLLTKQEDINYIAYAERYQDYLFTIEENKPNHLIIWDIAEHSEIKKIAEIDAGVKINGQYGSTKFYFYDYYLILKLKNKYLLVNFNNASDPKSTLVNEEIPRSGLCDMQYMTSHNRLYSYDKWVPGVFYVSTLPTIEEPNPEKKKVSLDLVEADKLKWDKYEDVLVKDDKIYLIVRNVLTTLDISDAENPKIIGHQALKSGNGRAFLLGQNKMAVMEGQNADEVGCRIFETTSKAPKKLGDILAKHIVRGYDVENDFLFLCHRDNKFSKDKSSGEETYKTYFSIVDVSEKNPSVKQTFELPHMEISVLSIRINDGHLLKICWMGVQNNQVSILLGSGKMLYFDLG
ncbi:WGR domain-containing protein [Flagellimonas sp. 2504JD4-2]